MKPVERNEFLPDTEAGRSLFRERLIAKIRRHRDFKTLPDEVRSIFFDELAALTLFGSNNPENLSWRRAFSRNGWQAMVLGLIKGVTRWVSRN
ncbi:MAG: hypothetical protein WBI41_01485 [Azovibrio sp.]|uniref:hypothetical protein n=1 Tax=Azovibrio sp. TaxID=1872673 RepID=UPI003C74DFDD